MAGRDRFIPLAAFLDYTGLETDSPLLKLSRTVNGDPCSIDRLNTT